MTSPNETGWGQSMAVTQYDVVLDIPQRPDVRIPALLLRLTERRSGGWFGTVRIDPRLLSAEEALQTLLRDGLTPGSAVVVKLLIAGSTAFAGTEIRTWPSVVTAVSAAGSYDVDDPEAICSVSFRDPVTYLGDRPIWAAFVDCPLDEMLGGVLSNAAGGDGRPTARPILPGLPTIRLLKELGDEVAKVHYAIAAGEPLGRWLSRVHGRLGVRMSMLGASEGTLQLTLCDVVPSRSALNGDGGLNVTLDPDRSPSATNIVLSGLDVNSPSIVRGGLLDSIQDGSPLRFGPNGALESVLTEPADDDEAARRAGFGQGNRRLAQTRVMVTSSQPGFLPGRIVNLKPRARGIGAARPVDAASSPREGIPSDAAALLGAGAWQLADVQHLCQQARYWNQASMEKTGLAWRPELPDERGATVVSGVVDDGSSKAGERVRRDRLGRIPIRFPFVLDLPGTAENPVPAASSPDIPWPPRLPLAPVAPGAGNQHGFVSDHRQGDSCRVAVVNPLLAEIIGYSYREDRHLGEDVRGATLGVVVREGIDGWQGLLFRPDEPDV